MITMAIHMFIALVIGAVFGYALGSAKPEKNDNNLPENH